MKLPALCMLIVGAFASSSDGGVDLAEAIEAGFPGGVNWFLEWAEEEKKIENYRHLIEGTLPVPDGFATLRLCDLAGFIYYLYDPQTPEVIAQVVAKAIQRGVFVSEAPLPALVDRVVQFRMQLTTLPASVFEMIQKNESPEAILEKEKKTGERRFNTIERVTAIVRIWRSSCSDQLYARNISREASCFLDPVSGLWVMSKTAAGKFIRANLLLVIRMRDQAIVKTEIIL